MGGSLWAAADHWRVVPGRLLSGPMGKEDGVARLVMGGQMLESISGVASERIKCLGWGCKCCGHRQIGLSRLLFEPRYPGQITCETSCIYGAGTCHSMKLPMLARSLMLGSMLQYRPCYRPNPRTRGSGHVRKLPTEHEKTDGRQCRERDAR